MRTAFGLLIALAACAVAALLGAGAAYKLRPSGTCRGGGLMAVKKLVFALLAVLSIAGASVGVPPPAS